MEINDQDFLEFGAENDFPVGGQISPGAVASAQVDKADQAMTNDLSPAKIAEAIANSVKINQSLPGDEIVSVTNKQLTDLGKSDLVDGMEIAGPFESERPSTVIEINQLTPAATPIEVNQLTPAATPIEVNQLTPAKTSIEVNQLTPAAVSAVMTDQPKTQADRRESGYGVEGFKSRKKDGTFEISLTLKDLISNAIVSDSLVVNEKQLDVAYTKAVEELVMPLAMRADSDEPANAIIRSMNSGKIEIPRVDERPASQSFKPFVESTISGTQSIPIRSEAPTRLEIMKPPALALEPIKTPFPTPAAITKTAMAEEPVAKSNEFIFGSMLGSDLLKPFTEEESKEVATADSKPKFSDTEILSAIFGSSQQAAAEPLKTAVPEVRVESGKPVPNKSVINEIVNPPNPVVPALEGLGQTITNTSSNMTETLAGKMESTFSSTAKSEATQMLANNVTNINNSQLQPTIEPMPQAAKPADQSQSAEPAGSGMSEYYLRAIYEALVVQGVKLRTI